MIYKIVCSGENRKEWESFRNDMENLEFLINKYIQQGFVPIGGICVSSNSNQFYQAMIKQ